MLHGAADDAALAALADEVAAVPGVKSATLGKPGRAGATTTDSYGRHRIDAQPPSYGSWKLRISVEGRPPGPLPGLSWGPSPAYPLAGAGARVTGFGLYPVR
jgi:hypothetical protein